MSGCNCVIKTNDGIVHTSSIGEYTCHLHMAEALGIDFDTIDECGWKQPDGEISWGHGDSLKGK
jgi:hypothetical protein